MLLLCTMFLAVSTAAAAEPVRQVERNRLISRSDPALVITLPKRVTYVGADRWDLYGICDAELHVFVEADAQKTVRALYWIQFEGYLPNNTHVYDYSADEPVTFAGRPFWKRARFGPTDEPQRAGSDGEHVRRMLERAGYKLPPTMMNVRLVHLLDDSRRQELMFIYAEAATAPDEGIAGRAMKKIRLSR